MLKASVVFVSFVLSSCLIPMGDAYIFVKGKIIAINNESFDECKLKMYLMKNDYLISETTIGMEFKTGVLISPYSSNYYIIILCGEYNYKSEIINIPDTRYYDSPLNLGDIFLTKQKEYASEAEVSPEKIDQNQ